MHLANLTQPIDPIVSCLNIYFFRGGEGTNVRLCRLSPLETAGITGVAYCYEDYIAHAEDPRKASPRMAIDETTKAAWLRVAAGYRDLAAMTQHRRLEREWRT